MFIRRFEVLAGNKTCEETYRKRHIDIEYILHIWRLSIMSVWFWLRWRYGIAFRIDEKNSVGQNWKNRIPYQSRNNTFFRKHRINVLANTNEWILQDMNYYITSYSDFHDDDTKPRMFE